MPSHAVIHACVALLARPVSHKTHCDMLDAAASGRMAVPARCFRPAGCEACWARQRTVFTSVWKRLRWLTVWRTVR